MLALLPEDDREALRLTDLDELPQKDLAAKLGVSLGAAKSRVQRARTRLKQAVLECCRVELDRRGRPIDYARKRDAGGSCSCE
jgi:RNA polymerase sigma-70 factor (ECF subfamily)